MYKRLRLAYVHLRGRSAGAGWSWAKRGVTTYFAYFGGLERVSESITAYDCCNVVD